MKKIFVLADARVLQGPIHVDSNFESEFIARTKGLRLAGFSVTINYFVRPDDVVVNREQLPFIWSSVSKEDRSIRIDEKEYVEPDCAIEFADLMTKIDGLQEDYICLVVSPDNNLLLQCKAKNCVTLSVADFGQFRFTSKPDFQFFQQACGVDKRVRVYQDTDDTTVLSNHSKALGRCILNPHMRGFYQGLLRFINPHQLEVQQITSRKLVVQQESVYSRDGGRSLLEMNDADSAGEEQFRLFCNAIHMPTVMDLASEMFASLGIAYGEEAIFTGGGPQAEPEDALLKLEMILRELNTSKARGQALPTQIFLMDDDFGQLDLNDTDVKRAYDGIRQLGVAVSLVWTQPGGVWEKSDLDMAFQAVSSLTSRQLNKRPREESSEPVADEENPAKRQQIGPSLFAAGPASTAAASSTKSAAP